MAVLKYYDANSQQYHSLPLGNESIAVYDNGYGYSTDEQVVGCWIDGKPIYRKVFSVGTLQTKTDTQNVALSNDNPPIDRLIRWNGSMLYGEEKPVALPGSHNGYYECAVRYSDNQIYLQYRNASTAKFGNVIISVEYTKTTDQPNSFSIDMLTVGDLDTEATDEEVAAVLG